MTKLDVSTPLSQTNGFLISQVTSKRGIRTREMKFIYPRRRCAWSFSCDSIPWRESAFCRRTALFSRDELRDTRGRVNFSLCVYVARRREGRRRVRLKYVSQRPRNPPPCPRCMYIKCEAHREKKYAGVSFKVIDICRCGFKFFFP